MKQSLTALSVLFLCAAAIGAETPAPNAEARAQKSFKAAIVRANAEYARQLAIADKAYLDDLETAIRAAKRRANQNEVTRLQQLREEATEVARAHQALASAASPLTVADDRDSAAAPAPAVAEIKAPVAKAQAISKATRAALPSEQELQAVRDAYRAYARGDKNVSYAALAIPLLARLEQDGESWTDADAEARWEAQSEIWKAENVAFSNDNIIEGFIHYATAAPDLNTLNQRVRRIEALFAGAGNAPALVRSRTYAAEWFQRHPAAFRTLRAKLDFCEVLRPLCKDPGPLEQYMKEIAGVQDKQATAARG